MGDGGCILVAGSGDYGLWKFTMYCKESWVQSYTILHHLGSGENMTTSNGMPIVLLKLPWGKNR